MAGRKIGILGGTFDPIHHVHLILGEAAREQFGLDRIIFIPSGCSYMKDTSSITPGELRYQMVKLAIENNPYFTCSRIEIDREGNSYTIDTLRELKKMYPGDEIYLILGGDTFRSIESWYESEEIFKNCIILAAVRDNMSIEDMDKQRRHLHDTYGADVRILSFKNLDLSSSDIRARMKTGRSVRYLLPDSVIEFACLKNIFNGIPVDNDTDDVKIYNG
ncbi:nicotinate-nucleotide adenylyltransferase [Butyrivibrio sp. INlla16]|uniref:nicotinate-nucleotide adenylyltransferase n=1 Tax=Butyrivibrio sp. INlla16 TaxID=1520807 RepID=UPI0008833D70|nr:nicotinate-nucleotide adenylyltransferase [Butyrivibrio sp. INlla16]SDB16165.1 nicotinate-nucleotide adenylyltransferase [Butyrivibrio sp. INlla16]